MYFGGSNSDELMDCNGDMQQYLDNNQVEDSKRLKFACTRLRGHASR